MIIKITHLLIIHSMWSSAKAAYWTEVQGILGTLVVPGPVILTPGLPETPFKSNARIRKHVKEGNSILATKR